VEIMRNFHEVNADEAGVVEAGQEIATLFD
jgi:hypothetical protein